MASRGRLLGLQKVYEKTSPITLLNTFNFKKACCKASSADESTTAMWMCGLSAKTQQPSEVFV